MEDRGKPITFTPKVVFMIAKDDNPGFGTKREEIFILLHS